MNFFGDENKALGTFNQYNDGSSINDGNKIFDLKKG